MEKNEVVASDSDEELMIEAWKKVKLSVKQKRDQQKIRLKSSNLWKRNMSEEQLKDGLEHTGADTDKIASRGRKRTTLATIMGVKAKRKKGEQGDMEVESDDDNMDVDDNENKTLQEKL